MSSWFEFDSTVITAAAGSAVLLIVCLWATQSTSKRAQLNNVEQYDAYYRRLMLMNSFLMCYGFFAMNSQNAVEEVRQRGDHDWSMILSIRISELTPSVRIALILSTHLISLHHTSNILRVQYEMRRDRVLFKRYLLLIQFIISVTYILLMRFTPFMVFFAVFANIDTLPHVIQIVLYWQLLRAVKTRPSRKDDIELQLDIHAKDEKPADSEHSITFCCNRVYVGDYASNDRLARRYWIGIIANILHQMSGFIMVGARLGIADRDMFVIRYNLDVIVGYIFAALSLIYWQKLIRSTPRSFANKSQTHEKAVVNVYTYMYYFCCLVCSLSVILSAVFFYLVRDIDVSMVNMVHVCKLAASCIALMVQLYAMPVSLYGDPIRWYYSALLIKINRYFAYNRAESIAFVTKNTLYLSLYGAAQCVFAQYLYTKYYVLASFICEIIQIVAVVYILIYRLIKGSAFFYDLQDWQPFLSGWKPLNDGYAKLKPNTSICPVRRRRCCCFKIFKILYIIKYVPILVLMLLINILLWLVIILASFYYLIRVYVFGSLCCTQSTYRIERNIRRYGAFFDYILFHVLFGLHLDKVLKVILENEPTKYYITHLAIIFFQTRYSWFVGSSIPDSNLEYDYICYDTLYNFGHNTYSRILPSATDEYEKRLPPAKDVMQLFLRKEGGFQREDNLNLSLLFAFYVRWFTHQFCSTNPDKPKTTNSPIGVNLSQLYGSTKEWERKTRKYQDGLMKTSVFHGKEYPPVNEDGFFVSEAIPQPQHHDNDFYCIQILFFRHHQYIARSLRNEYPEMNDEQLFQTAKLCNILTAIKCTMSLYGELGLVQTNLSAKFEVTDMENLYNTWMYKLFGPKGKIFPQNSANVFIEFNIMYRWHQFVPPEIKLVDVDNHLKRNTGKDKVHKKEEKKEKKEKKARFRDLDDLVLEETWNEVNEESKQSHFTSPVVRVPTHSERTRPFRAGDGSPMHSPMHSPMSKQDSFPDREMSKQSNFTSPVARVPTHSERMQPFRLGDESPIQSPMNSPMNSPMSDDTEESQVQAHTKSYSRYSNPSINSQNHGHGVSHGSRLPFKLDLGTHRVQRQISLSDLALPDVEEEDDEDEEVLPGFEDQKYPDIDELEKNLSRLHLPFLSATRCLLMKKHGLERFMYSASNTAVGKLTLFNTDPFLCRVAVLPTIEKTRLYKLRSFNDYRERFGFPRYQSFEEFSDDEEIAIQLERLYKTVDDVEFYVGIFAEQKVGKALHGPTLTAIFSSFVMSFVTSSLLFRKPWDKMLTPLGKQIVNNTEHVRELIRLHTDLEVENFSFRVDED